MARSSRNSLSSEQPQRMGAHNNTCDVCDGRGSQTDEKCLACDPNLFMLVEHNDHADAAFSTHQRPPAFNPNRRQTGHQAALPPPPSPQADSTRVRGRVATYEPGCTGYYEYKNIGGSGSSYIGDFVDGKMCGKGTLSNTDAVHTGSFRNNLFHGSGITKYTDGSKYEGGFQNGVRCGIGTYHYSNGDVYSGEWQRDVRHGHGKLTIGGQTVEGLWVNDEQVEAEPAASSSSKRVESQRSYSLWTFGISGVTQVASHLFKTTYSVLAQTGAALGISSGEEQRRLNKMKADLRSRRVAEEQRRRDDKIEAERRQKMEEEQRLRDAEEAERQQREAQQKREQEQLEAKRRAEDERRRQREAAEAKRIAEEQERARQAAEEQRRREVEAELKRVADETARVTLQQAEQERKRQEPAVEFRALLSLLKAGTRTAQLKESIEQKSAMLSDADKNRVLREVEVSPDDFRQFLEEPAPPPPAEDDDSRTCVHCCDLEREYCIGPCGHLCVCAECKDHYINGNCPLCREPVQSLQKVYF